MNAVFAILALIVSYIGMIIWLYKMFPNVEYKTRMGIAGGIAFIVSLLVLLGTES